MCRNIKTLFNFQPPATNEEIEAASIQYIRKVSGFVHPSKVNEKVYLNAIEEIKIVTQNLLNALKTEARFRDRAIEATKAHERNAKRFNLGK